MKRISTLFVLLLSLPIVAFSSQIYGNLRMDNAPVQGAQVKIQCAAAEPYYGQTDGYGSYRVPLDAAKDCVLSVNYGGKWSQAFAVYPYDDPVRYDFDLFWKDGSIALKRR